MISIWLMISMWLEQKLYLTQVDGTRRAAVDGYVFACCDLDF